MAPMMLRSMSRTRRAVMLMMVTGLCAASVASASAATPKTSKAFCGDAKNLAALDTKTLKDVTSSLNVTSPGYVSKQFGATLAT